METVNIHEAKTHLSRLIARAVKGEPFIIAKAGKPLVKVIPVESQQSETQKRRFGFLKDANFEIPDDFDTLGQEEIEALFYRGGDS